MTIERATRISLSSVSVNGDREGRRRQEDRPAAFSRCFGGGSSHRQAHALQTPAFPSDHGHRAGFFLLAAFAPSARADDRAQEYEQVRKIALRDPKVREAFQRAEERLQAKIDELDPALKSRPATPVAPRAVQFDRHDGEDAARACGRGALRTAEAAEGPCRRSEGRGGRHAYRRGRGNDRGHRQPLPCERGDLAGGKSHRRSAQASGRANAAHPRGLRRRASGTGRAGAKPAERAARDCGSPG